MALAAENRNPSSGETMSAPKTNIEKQKKRHKGPLFGIKGVMIFAAVLLAGLLIWLVYEGNEPRESDAAIIETEDENQFEEQGIEVPQTGDDAQATGEN